MKYEIHDSHGAPQCGCEVTRFDDSYAMDDYLCDHPDVCERINEGYATIVEKPCYEKFVLLFVKERNERKRAKVIAIIECDEETAHGLTEEYGLSVRSYTTYRPYDGETVGQEYEL